MLVRPSNSRRNWRVNGSAFAGGGSAGAAEILVEELVDADQSVRDGHRPALVDVHLAVVAAEVLQRLAAADHLEVRLR